MTNRFTRTGLGRIGLAMAVSLGLSGCAYYGETGYYDDPYYDNGYAYGDYCDGYSAYDAWYGCDYRYGFGGIGFGGGYYDNFYYPGYGVYIYDRPGGRRYAMQDRHRRYWAQRRFDYWRSQRGERRADRRDDRREWRDQRPDRRGDYRDQRRDGREAYRDQRRDGREAYRDQRRDGREAYRDQRRDGRDATRDQRGGGREGYYERRRGPQPGAGAPVTQAPPRARPAPPPPPPVTAPRRVEPTGRSEAQREDVRPQ